MRMAMSMLAARYANLSLEATDQVGDDNRPGERQDLPGTGVGGEQRVGDSPKAGADGALKAKTEAASDGRRTSADEPAQPAAVAGQRPDNGILERAIGAWEPGLRGLQGGVPLVRLERIRPVDYLYGVHHIQKRDHQRAGAAGT